MVRNGQTNKQKTRDYNIDFRQILEEQEEDEEEEDDRNLIKYQFVGPGVRTQFKMRHDSNRA